MYNYIIICGWEKIFLILVYYLFSTETPSDVRGILWGSEDLPNHDEDLINLAASLNRQVFQKNSKEIVSIKEDDEKDRKSATKEALETIAEFQTRKISSWSWSWPEKSDESPGWLDDEDVAASTIKCINEI